MKILEWNLASPLQEGLQGMDIAGFSSETVRQTQRGEPIAKGVLVLTWE